MNRLWKTLVAALPFAVALSLHAALSIDIDAAKPGPRISPTQWGIFFEDINFGADGGLYAELVKNRSFEFPDPLTGWLPLSTDPKLDGQLDVLTEKPLHPNTAHYVRLTLGQAPAGFGLINEGFRGIGVTAGASYEFSVWARSTGEKPADLRAMLNSPSGRNVGEVILTGFSDKWTRLTGTIRATATEPKTRLIVLMKGPGTLDLDMVSLFPKETFKNRPNGLRADVAQLLADLKPGFMRFPGGCIVEGHWLTNRYQWKTTIGEVAGRKLILNRWNDEFKHRPAPDYFQSFGLGFFEFFQFCEDIGCEPLPILNCGMACQFNSGELAPLDQLQPYIQDALDLIEFANGPTASPWGAKRAALGHPNPFHLKVLGIGNEQWLQPYMDRYERFAKAIQAKHPEIKLVSSAGPGPNDDKFHFAWKKLREFNADIVDEHCYDKPAWFFNSATRYDHYPRTGPKVFMGEYAAQSVKTCSPDNKNNWECALAEAAFMTGLERNADVVVMSSYAPLSAHVDAWQWRPNLIWFDNLRAFGTPNYYVQQTFSRNRGDVVLPTTITGQAAPTGEKPGLYATAARDEQTGQIILKVVNGAAKPADVTLRLIGAKLNGSGQAIVLTGEKLTDENSLDEPLKVSPKTAPISGVAPEFKRTFAPWSLTVLRLEEKR